MRREADGRKSISVRALRFPLVWPRFCACCMRPAETECWMGRQSQSGGVVVTTWTVAWKIPFCANCKHHHKMAVFSYRVGIVLTMWVFFGFFQVPAAVSKGRGFQAVLPLLIWGGPPVAYYLFWRFRRRAAKRTMTPECTRVCLPVEYGKDGLFRFSNAHYAEEFVRRNTP